MRKPIFPVGYIQFHPDSIINFQLNARLYSPGIFSKEEVSHIAGRVKNFDYWKEQMIAIAKKYEKEGKYHKAATAYRSAEFFLKKDDPDKKNLFYKCKNMYKKAFEYESINWEFIDYKNGKLFVMKIKPEDKIKGVIVLHGGYDSFIEEFYNLIKYFVCDGYEVIMFEGPGQGYPLYEYDMKMTHKWELPVKKVLDYYKLNDVTLIGISQGGYFAARAAAFEPRIKKVVLYDIVYDLYGAVMNQKKPIERYVTDMLIKVGRKEKINSMAVKICQINSFADWMIHHGYHVMGVDTLFDYMVELKKYNTRKISSLIKQDVLLMEGEEDMFMCYFEKQKKALKNAKSVTARVFRKEEQASHHCQVGNFSLAFNYILEWINKI